MVVCIFEQEEGYLIEALEGGRRLWQERTVKTGLESWLKSACDSGRIKRQQTLLLVLPEPLLVRRVLDLPQTGKAYQLRGMAANALLPLLNERPGALAVAPMAGARGFAVCGCKKNVLTQHLAAFGRYRRRVRIIGAADHIAAKQPALPDGCYALQDPLWTAVIAVCQGRVIDGRAAYGGSSFGLWQELAQAHCDEPLFSTNAQPLAVQPEAVPDEAALRLAALQPSSLQLPPGLVKDRLLLALLIGCVALPGLLFLAGLLRPAGVAEDTENTAVASVARSEYHTLLTQAYAVKSERIALLNQEAGENTLALSGRCSEALDLADYMRQLAAAEPSLHPLLLEMTRKSEENSQYYEFTVQISLEGGGSS